ncbi:protein PHOTOPERIOD-INDEPENDENT EARLY FLOWERING 1 isoform X2 [Populus alba]|uniref:protein PHOTOPERIOD-INDEPENDENT EARLY FLOWERING 1 isoform X2 n=1 Tax=Populus alba TaxID=43335 RepID=UPI00158DF325|nr:protein PHOTOPERIOD-INDEPENDENT EARLY FLOWERING 1-like isoform X1 [Populus alba]
MASKGPRSKLDHETRARRQKALEAPREPHRPKTHWDHVLEEMVWLSKDFESERKWKLAQAKKVALRASKGMLDQATRGEKKLKEEEQRLRKVALNISKDVKKFWVKIEKLVLYKHQMVLDEKKKKALDKQLEFLLGQTERYSTMLAENLVDKPSEQYAAQDKPRIAYKKGDDAIIPEQVNDEPQLDTTDNDDEYDVQSEDGVEDDEHTIEEDEALITAEERQEELEALHNETDIPLEELLNRYTVEKGSRESSENGATPSANGEDHCERKGNNMSAASDMEISCSPVNDSRRCGENNGALPIPDNDLLEIRTNETRYQLSISDDPAKERVPYDFSDEQEDGDFNLVAEEEKDDETTLLEEEELAKADSKNPIDEISLLQKESEIPLEELLARYTKEPSNEVSEDESEYASLLSDNVSNSPGHEDELKQLDNSMDGIVEHGNHPLVEEQEKGNEKFSEDGRESESRIADAAAAARSAQPTGNTFSTTKVRTKFPFLLKYPLREYQHIGLDWLVTMYEKRLNGILADEMGLGKTIMTIALLAHLACEKGIWGPHLIVVPTSVMLNWETEFLKWCPAFKILTYFGSAKERKCKRQGWLKPNSFHVCITTYRLVIQDSKVFKRKKWKYLILDEAHLIKNWKSQRWQTLLNFNSKRRILLTGTPLQNDLMELWSLMHFLMPHVFQSHQEFKDWFSNPITGMVEGQERVNKEVVDRLHNVLRPFILRRLKRDVEKQLPMKHEHVIYCRLSRRQRNLYEDFIASSETQATLATANFFGMISIIMQLRKVCNHPDLFEGRPIISSFDMAGIDMQLSSSVCSMLSPGPFSSVDLCASGLIFTHLDFIMASWEYDEVKSIATPSRLIKERSNLDNIEVGPGSKHLKKLPGTNIFEEIRKSLLEERLREVKERAASIAWWNSLRCQKKPIYSTTLRELLTVKHPIYDVNRHKTERLSYLYFSKLGDVIVSPIKRFQKMIDLVESFMFAIPAARTPVPVSWCSQTRTPVFLHSTYEEKCSEMLLPLLSPIRPAIVRRQLYFPDRRLIQFDCGKLQELAILLRKLKSEGHRVLIFTQMTKMLDILEVFMNLYGYTYMRLDGSTQPEERQTLMQRFNTNPKIFIFILSTRSGGVGINLVGADTVIFYDSDWNPAMDQQAQDRCHRIGQTREVHIYRLISESTIEENILKKANQKRALDDLVIQSGGYNTEFFKKLDPMELFSGHKTLQIKNMQREKNHNNGNEVSLSTADVDAALKYAEDEADYMALKKVEQEEAVDNQEFTEEAIGRLEDEEFVNDDDMKADEPTDHEMTTYSKDVAVNLKENGCIEERAVTFTGNEDVDTLADVKQMAAAAAAAGQAISSFENQLRPIDRYAVQFLELWDPIIDKAALESQVGFEETEWELDRIEKYKEEMEAEIDDDEEPLVYERWDADFATEAYRQEVEALTQHQLLEEQEAEANEKEGADDGHLDAMVYKMPRNPKLKSKKKPKKAKFKSLKKESLTSELKHVKEEESMETLSVDDDDDDGTYSDTMSPCSSMRRKRKKAESAIGIDKTRSKKKTKKFKKGPETCTFNVDSDLSGKQHDKSMELKPNEVVVSDIEQKPASRSKMGGKISISTMPVKRVLMIKPEKLKKGNVWLKDCVPPPDLWMPQEDAVLCAVVHEYGPHWSLVSETLYGMTAGGFYRGRYRHPVHCCERFRELIHRYVLFSPENLINNEKMSNMVSGKALLKVTEDNIRMLLNVVAEQPDHELLLQKHFTALLSSVWRVKSHVENQQNMPSSRNALYNSERVFNSSVNPLPWNSLMESAKRMKFTNLGQSTKLLAAALHDASSRRPGDRVSNSNVNEEAPAIGEKLEITLEFQKEENDYLIPFPPVISLSIPGSAPWTSVNKDRVAAHHLRASTSIAENRFRDAARASSSVLPANDLKLWLASKTQSLGKHKLSVSSTKPPRSKARKTLLERNEGHAEPVMQPPSVRDPNLRFDLPPAVIQDDTDGFSISCMEKELSVETGISEAVPHNYVPDLISGLDDYSLLPEYTDIG